MTRISPDKDVDGFNPVNAGRLAIGLHGFVPCTPLGCLYLLKQEISDLAGLNAVVIGRSNIVGKPMALLLLRENCTVTIAHSRTRDLPRRRPRCRHRGRRGREPGDGQGRLAEARRDRDRRRHQPDTSRGGEERLVGDVDFATASDVAGAITPVPGGVGPMTIACLIRNTFVSAARREGFAMEEPMIAAFLLASAPVTTAIDVERAFAADAQKIGQWTAFRKYADQDAVMFTPQAVWVRDFLPTARTRLKPSAGRRRTASSPAMGGRR